MSPQTPESDAALAAHWRRAITDRQVVEALESIYAELAEEIEARGPACWASGRCCNFANSGHRLYVTGLETAYALARLGEAAERNSDAERATPNEGRRLAVIPQVGGGSAPLARCPFQVENLCGVHLIRPLGCRAYFCDRSAQAWQQDAHERALNRLRDLHERFSIEYRYMEWGSALAMFNRGSSESLSDIGA